MCSHCVIQISLSTEGSGHVAMWSLSQYGQSGLFSKHISRGKLQWDVSTSRVFVGLQTAVIHTVSWNCTLPLVTGLVNNVAVQLNAVARASTTSHHSTVQAVTLHLTWPCVWKLPTVMVAMAMAAIMIMMIMWLGEHTETMLSGGGHQGVLKMRSGCVHWPRTSFRIRDIYVCSGTSL